MENKKLPQRYIDYKNDQTKTTLKKKCEYIYMRGNKKGTKCEKATYGEFCHLHNENTKKISYSYYWEKGLYKNGKKYRAQI